jgi:CheY-like chemotaxis protein
VVAKYDASSFALSAPGIDGASSGISDTPIFVIDDSESDRFFLMRAFRASGVKNPVRFLESGAEAVQYLSGQGKYSDRALYPLPRIVFIDLQMPPPNGLEVLQWKESRTDLPPMLWVAMSGFNAVKTINEAYDAGASTFLAKPLDGADIQNLVGAFEDYSARVAPRC